MLGQSLPFVAGVGVIVLGLSGGGEKGYCS